jgi:threonine synthase
MNQTKEYEIVCTKCGNAIEHSWNWLCQNCNGTLVIEFKKEFNKNYIKSNLWSLWRYSEFLPLQRQYIVSMQEGCSPLLKIDSNLLLKLDYMMPTGSYKDRGTSTLITYAKEYLARNKDIEKKTVDDSSGNAGASIAAYSSFAGIKCQIFVFEGAVKEKLNQIKAYGAEVVIVKGTRKEVAKATIEAAKNSFYASHILCPFFMEGIKTFSYEVWEQMNHQVPDYIFIPTSAGTLLLGIYKGFKHLKLSGLIESMPKLVCCQTLKISPVYHKLYNKPYQTPKDTKNIADALVDTNPARMDEILLAVKDTKGGAEIANEDEILSAQKELANIGIFVEPSSAVAYACWKKWEDKIRSKGEKALIDLTGSGLKTKAILSHRL